MKDSPLWRRNGSNMVSVSGVILPASLCIWTFITFDSLSCRQVNFGENKLILSTPNDQFTFPWVFYQGHRIWTSFKGCRQKTTHSKKSKLSTHNQIGNILFANKLPIRELYSLSAPRVVVSPVAPQTSSIHYGFKWQKHLVVYVLKQK